MEIQLDPATERLFLERLKSGHYAAAGDLVSAALAALSRLEAQEMGLADLRKKVAVGIEAANRGELSDGDEFFAELEREEIEAAAHGRKTA